MNGGSRKMTCHCIFYFFVIYFCFTGSLINAQPLAQGKSKFLGAGSSSEVFPYFNRYWNQITPGNDGKWGSVERSRRNYTWTNLDNIYNYAINKKILFKEHTLVWGQQQPSWITSLDSAEQREAVEEWIRRIGERYPNMALIDVVNEPLHAQPPYKNALGGNGATGWDWVITVFELARQYCPQSKLLINEYNVLHSNSQTTAYMTIIHLLKERELIDGIGIQGHYFEFRSHVDATSNIYVHDINTIKANLDRLASLNLPIYITEFDIDERDDTNQLNQYQIYFPIFWNHSAVKGITFWGYIQGDVWGAHPNTYILLYDGKERPAMQWLKTYVRSPFIPILIAPDQQENVARNPLLVWHASETASEYRVQIAKDHAFSTMVLDTMLADTALRVNLEANQRYYWRVNAKNSKGTSEFSAIATFVTGDYISDVEKKDTVPSDFELSQNYPNPFNGSSVIEFSISIQSHVELKLYNLLGQEVTALVDKVLPQGKHRVRIDAETLHPGIYFYKLKAGQFEKTKKMVIIK